MIPKNEKDILNLRNTVSNHPDDTELDIWLSWIQYPIYLSMVEIADINKKLEELKFKLSTLEERIFISLKKEDYTNMKAMKAVVKGREDVMDLKREVEKTVYELSIANIKLNKYKNRNRTIYLLADNRANTSNYQENIDWVVRNRRSRI